MLHFFPYRLQSLTTDKFFGKTVPFFLFLVGWFSFCGVSPNANLSGLVIGNTFNFSMHHDSLGIFG